jgi:(p)ppGpp synthase/HD superfamily hydrolase
VPAAFVPVDEQLWNDTDNMKEWIAVLRAADAAARWHVHQRRKGIAQEPYINHLLEVASLVGEATGGTDPNVVIAALLHDAIEDQGVTSEVLASEFGQHVADVVMEVSDDKTLPKDERKRRQIETASKKSREAKLIKLADKISNLRTIAVSPAADWSVERRLEYIEWAKAVVAGLRGTSPWLEQRFDEAVAAAERSLNPSLAGI